MLSMARGRRRGAQAVVIVVTDGKSQDDVIGPAQMLRSRGIKVRNVNTTLKGGLATDRRVFLFEGVAFH